MFTALVFQETKASEPIPSQVLPVCEKIFHQTRVVGTHKNPHWGETIHMSKMQQGIFSDTSLEKTHGKCSFRKSQGQSIRNYWSAH